MDEFEVIRKRKIVLFLGSIVFIVFIIAISMLISKLSETDYKVSIVNASSSRKDRIISNDDFDRLKAEVRRVMTNNYGIDSDEQVEVSIRESSYTEERLDGASEEFTTIKFLADVENTKSTYWVWLVHNSTSPIDISLNCASASESKYPDTFCIGTSGNSSIDANFKDLFPFVGVNNDGSRAYTFLHKEHQQFIELGVDAMCDDNEAIDRAKADLEKEFKKRGIKMDNYPINIDKGTCKAYEVVMEHEGSTV